MKKLLLSFIMAMIIVQACSQTEEEMVATFASDSQTVANPLWLLDTMSLMDFKDNFVSSGPRKPLEPSTCPLLFKHRKSIKIKDKDALMEAYNIMKEDIIYYLSQDAAYHGGDFQHLALRMLYYHFLPDSSLVAVNETLFLLEKLIQTKAVDLDVMANAYLKVQHRLTSEQKADYMNYFKKLYYKDKDYIAKNFPIFKEGYETSTEMKKRDFLYKGRFLVRMSQALRYTNDLLHIETEQKN